MKDLLPNIEVYRFKSDSSDEFDSDSESHSTPESHSDIESDPAQDSNSLDDSDSPQEPSPTREPVRIILIGSSISTNLVIGVLHTLGFAETRAWSKPQIDPTSGKPMRILTKWVRH